MIKKIIAFMMVAILVCTAIPVWGNEAFAMQVSASDEVSDSESSLGARYTYIVCTNTSLGISNGVANSMADVTCDSSTTKSCTVTAYLQRRQIGTATWRTVATYNGSGTSYAIATGSNSSYIVSGYEYRVMAKYIIKGISGGSETVYGYSKTIQVS